MADTIDPELRGFTREELTNFFYLLPRIFCDYRPPERGALEMLYLYSLTPDNADGLFIKAIEMEKVGKTKLIGIAEGDLGHGYAGFDASLKRFLELRGSHPYFVEKFDVGGNVNTASEANKLAQYAAAHDGDIGIVGVPFHIVRAFMTTVTALRNAGLDRKLRVYSYVGAPSDWQEEVVHSQGILKRTRKGLLESELERLDRYRLEKYKSLASAQEVLDYLDWRDN
jgi:hypothetical protein